MKRKSSIQPLVRRGIYVVLFVLAAVLQGTFLGAARFTPVLLVPLTAAVCAHEREFAGLFFGLLGGVLYDALSPAADGVFTLLFAAAGCAVGLLMHYVFRGTLLSVFILTLAFSLLTVITGFVFTVLIHDAGGALGVFRRGYLPCALVTALLLPLFYYPVRALDSGLR